MSKKFDTTRNELKKEEIKFSNALIETGIPHEKIIQVATREKVDFIVLGKRGIGLKDRSLIGSTTLKV
ncbi:MAG: universal stress protein [Thermodesulfobacteriota bacterium]